MEIAYRMLQFILHIDNAQAINMVSFDFHGLNCKGLRLFGFDYVYVQINQDIELHRQICINRATFSIGPWGQ